MTDPLSDQPMTEADICAMLAWGEKWDLTDTTALARECLRLRKENAALRLALEERKGEYE